VPAPARPAPPRLVGALLAAALATAPAGGAEPGPFEASRLEVPGRPLEASAAAVQGERAQRLVVVSAEGAAPDERRHVTAFRAGPGGALEPAGALEVPAEVVAFDVADALPGGGLEIALLTAERLELRDLATGAPLRTRRFEPPLPLPPRTRGLDRRPLLAAWSGNGAVSALVPALGGLVHAPLDDGAVQRLALPLVTDYVVGDDAAGVRPGVLEARIGWPELGLGDDDGDGRADLLALGRYDVAVFRSGPAGLPPRVSRHASLRPFTAEEELRFQATSASLFARDLDGDGLVDLVLHRTFGTLLRSDATTSFWRNRGSGADPGAPPDARIAGSGGFGSVFLEDLDGDGRSEALQLFVPFGVIQLVRALLTESVQAELRAYRLTLPEEGLTRPEGGPEGPGLAVQPSFETTLSLALSSDEGRVAGVLPTVRGDWNGDGLRDLLHGESLRRLAIRLGARGERGPGFGGEALRLDVPSADRAVVADLDGDGLDDLALYDTRGDGSGVQVLRNRGVLKGGPPELRGPER
jgi:hypothetical protein